MGLREEKGIYVFDGWVSPAVAAGRKRPESVSLTPYEQNVDVATVDFPKQENHPYDRRMKTNPMNPDDVQASEEVGDEQAIPNKSTSVSNTADTQIQEHVLTHLPPRSWSRQCLR